MKIISGVNMMLRLLSSLINGKKHKLTLSLKLVHTWSVETVGACVQTLNS
jgi:hypothetical protein